LIADLQIHMPSSPEFSLASILQLETDLSEGSEFEGNTFSFRSSRMEKAIYDGSVQNQPLLHLIFGKREIAFVQGEYQISGRHIALHTKIHNKLQDRFKGRGLGSLIALIFARYMQEMEGLTLVSSRSNSLDAMKLWQRLEQMGFAKGPTAGSLPEGFHHLLNNSTREKMGLPDKFQLWPDEFFTEMAVRYQMIPETVAAQNRVWKFFQERFTG